MTVTQMTFLRNRPYQAVSMTHFFIDILNSSRNLLVAIIAVAIGLTNTQVGVVLLLYNIGGSLSQPFFGWLADRIGARWLVIGGLGWMICFFGLASITGDWLALVALTVAGLGSGAFHPTGTMVASQTSQSSQGKATAVFFFSGQFGLFLGPVLAGILLQEYGRPGYIVLPALAIIAFVYAWQYLPVNRQILHKKKEEQSKARQIPSLHWTTLMRQAIPLIIIILTGSTVSIAAITFAPKLFTEMNYLPAYVGLLSGFFMLGSAVGGIIGGALADRIVWKWVIILGMAGLILPIYFYIPAAGAFQVVLLLTAGFFSGIPHTILVLMVQALFPGRQAMASGLALGLMFTGGAIGSFGLGIIADQIGLATALQATAVLPILGLIAAIFLPQRTRR